MIGEFEFSEFIKRKREEVQVAKDKIKSEEKIIGLAELMQIKHRLLWKDDDHMLILSNAKGYKSTDLYRKLEQTEQEIYDRLKVRKYSGLEEGTFARYVKDNFFSPILERFERREMKRKEYDFIRRHQYKELADHFIEGAAKTYGKSKVGSLNFTG